MGSFFSSAVSHMPRVGMPGRHPCPSRSPFTVASDRPRPPSWNRIRRARRQGARPSWCCLHPWPDAGDGNRPVLHARDASLAPFLVHGEPRLPPKCPISSFSSASAMPGDGPAGPAYRQALRGGAGAAADTQRPGGAARPLPGRGLPEFRQPGRPPAIAGGRAGQWPGSIGGGGVARPHRGLARTPRRPLIPASMDAGLPPGNARREPGIMCGAGRGRNGSGGGRPGGGSGMGPDGSGALMERRQGGLRGTGDARDVDR